MNQQRPVFDYACGVELCRKFAFNTSLGHQLFVPLSVYKGCPICAFNNFLMALRSPQSYVYLFLRFYCITSRGAHSWSNWSVPALLSQDALRIHITAKRASSELAAHGSCYATLREMANSDYVPVMT